ncbi:MAG: alpha-ribazole phosphatase family protein [Gammaproteobacteria bacterium]|nr:alpha-ribazole phosphatase family protein [Gammaproteobacteria bacterium]
MFVDLLRHGEAEGQACFRGHTDDPLSSLGWQQMRAALQEYQTDCVIYSPLKRCAEFARQWAQQQQHCAHEMAEFMEMNFGDWDGVSAEHIQVTHAHELNAFWHDPLNNTPPNGEKLLDFQQRIVAGWENLICEHSDKNVLLVTHGGVIRMIIAHVLSIPLSQLLSIECPLASMSRIRISFDEDEKQYASLVFHAGAVK